MPTDSPSSDLALHNQLLGALPKADYQRLQPHLEYVTLTSGQVLYQVGSPITRVYFPIRALASLVSSEIEQSATEFGLVGREGMIGVPALLGGQSTISQAIVQVPNGAMQIDASRLKTEFDRGAALQKQILLYLQLSLTETAQNVACRVQHPVEPRLARWLLSIQDRLQSEEIPMTQRFMAMLLGTRRATITEVADRFQRAAMIRYHRGRITIRDRAALEHTACGCYQLLQRERERLQSISQTLS